MTRITANTATLGTSAPFLSVAEDSAAVGAIALGIVLPYVMGAMFHEPAAPNALAIGCFGLVMLPRLLPKTRRRVRSK